MSIYVCAVVEGKYLAETYAKELGKVSVGKSCIRFKKLEDVHLPTLKKLIVLAAENPGLSGIGVKKSSVFAYELWVVISAISVEKENHSSYLYISRLVNREFNHVGTSSLWRSWGGSFYYLCRRVHVSLFFFLVLNMEKTHCRLGYCLCLELAGKQFVKIPKSDRSLPRSPWQ